MNQLVKTTLWPHQLEVADKFERLPGVLAGWAMGTGKTLYGIERDLRMREIYRKGGRYEFKTLVVAPRAVHPNWLKALQYETDGYFDGIPRIMHMDPKKRDLFFEDGHQYYLMHWEALRFLIERRGKAKVIKPIKALEGLGFDHVILDEVHRIKNWRTKQPPAVVVAAKHLEIRVKTDMSGSIVHNRPEDLWSPLNHLYPKAFPAFWPFARRYIASHTEDRRDGEPYIVFDGPTQAWCDEREGLIGGFTSLIDDDTLPYLNLGKPTEIRLECQLTPKQRRAYDSMEKEMLAWVDDGMSGLPEDSPLAVNAVIAKLMRLQQFAIGYMEFTGYKIVKDVEQPEYKMTLPSAKLELVKDFMADTDESFVVFSQFTQPLELLAAMMPDYVSLYTGKNVKDRDTNLERFKAGNQKVIAMTYGAGGEGIDGLQHVCRNMIRIDRPWVPGVDKQAVGRLRRAGQTKPVNIIDIVAVNTVDDDRLEKIKHKLEINQRMLGLKA